MQTLTFKNLKKYLKDVNRHRKYVFYYSKLIGIPMTGFFHDLSRYNPIELIEYVRYYTDFCSTADDIKKKNGRSYAWLHHKSKNKHHYEYWFDGDIERNGYGLFMPKKYFFELVCDYLAFGHEVYKDNFSYKNQETWWAFFREGIKMHPMNKKMLDIIFSDLKNTEISHIEYPNVYPSPEELLKSDYLNSIWRANAINYYES